MSINNLQQNVLEIIKKDKSLKNLTAQQPKEYLHKWRLFYHSKYLLQQNSFAQSIHNQQQNSQIPSSYNEFSINIGKKIEEDQQGWHWYKNLIIPTIKVFQNQDGLQLTDQTSQNPSILNNNTHFPQNKVSSCEKLQATLIAFKKINNHTILPVIISGNQTQNIHQGKAIFKGLKFEETCFMSKSSFFVMTLVFHIDDQIQAVYISPRIQIEARKKYWQDRQTMMEVFDPFLPKLLSMEHKEGKANLSFLQKVKGSDFESILNYFSNITIRHKIRHPLFLFLKFPESIKLYTNDKLINPQSSDKQKMVELQKSFYNSIKNPNPDVPREQKSLIIQLSKIHTKAHLDIIQKNVNKYMQGLECSSITYLQDPNEELPPSFTELTFNDHSHESYTQAYSSIINIQFQAQMGGLDTDDKSRDLLAEQETDLFHKDDPEAAEQIVKKRQLDNLNTVIDVQKQVQKYKSLNKDKRFYVVQVRKTDFNLISSNLEPKKDFNLPDKQSTKELNLQSIPKHTPESVKQPEKITEKQSPQQTPSANPNYPENQFLKQKLIMHTQIQSNLNKQLHVEPQSTNTFFNPVYQQNTFYPSNQYNATPYQNYTPYIVNPNPEPQYVQYNPVFVNQQSNVINPNLNNFNYLYNYYLNQQSPLQQPQQFSQQSYV